MNIVGNAMERLFGPSQNGQIVELLVELADIGCVCARLLRESRCKDLNGVIALEHKGDDAEERLHETVDRAFILRFDKSDITNLAGSLDNILDGMRRVAAHVHTYSPYIEELRPESLEFLQIIEEMTSTVRKLASILSQSRLPLAEVKGFARSLAKAESKADALFGKAETVLVREFERKKRNPLVFIAWDKLFRFLEEVTDSANHCGTLVVSIARKEA